MRVVDASVLFVALALDNHDGDSVRAVLRGQQLAAPDLIDLEVVSALRKHVSIGLLDERRAHLALQDLQAIPLERARHAPLLSRCWELRDNFTAYDAAYIALAEALGATLLTADDRMARAPGSRCHIELLSSAT